MAKPIPLIVLRGMIASLAIENDEHNRAIERIDMLRGKFGDLAKVNFDEVLPILYK